MYFLKITSDLSQPEVPERYILFCISNAGRSGSLYLWRESFKPMNKLRPVVESKRVYGNETRNFLFHFKIRLARSKSVKLNIFPPDQIFINISKHKLSKCWIIKNKKHISLFCLLVPGLGHILISGVTYVSLSLVFSIQSSMFPVTELATWYSALKLPSQNNICELFLSAVKLVPNTPHVRRTCPTVWQFP